MSCAAFDERLDDLIDGELDPTARIEVERHLGGCASCREELAARQALARAVARLPREILPARDLLPGIRRAIERPADAGTRAAPRRWLAAAAMLSALALGGLLLERRLADDIPPVAQERGQVLEAFDAAEASFDRASTALLATLDQRLPALSPDTRAAIEESLVSLDRAIIDLRAAVEADPGNWTATHSLHAVQRRKIELLRTVSRLSS